MKLITITIINGRNKGQTHFIGENSTILVGRDDTADIKIEQDNRISRKHAIIALKEGSAYVLDLHSTNGTYLNGEKIDGKVVIKDGDTIRIGKTQLKVSLRKKTEGIPI